VVENFLYYPDIAPYLHPVPLSFAARAMHRYETWKLLPCWPRRGKLSIALHSTANPNMSSTAQNSSRSVRFDEEEQQQQQQQQPPASPRRLSVDTDAARFSLKSYQSMISDDSSDDEFISPSKRQYKLVDKSETVADLIHMRDDSAKAHQPTAINIKDKDTELEQSNENSPLLSPSAQFNARASSYGSMQPVSNDPQVKSSDPNRDIWTQVTESQLFHDLTDPSSLQRRIWLVLIFLILLYNSIWVPFRLSFQSLWTNNTYILTGFTVLDYLGDMCFLADVMLNFYTPYSHELVYERDLTTIKKHYIETWFIPDLISSIPIDILFLNYGIHTVMLVRLTRLIKFLKYSEIFASFDFYGSSATATHGLRFAKLTLALFLALHWLACLWVYLGYINGFGASTWVPPAEMAELSLLSQYIAAYWWSTNIITQVGGDPGLPSNDLERLLDLFIAFLSVFVISIVIGNVSELVSELNAEENELREKLTNLNQTMYVRKLPGDLQDRIRNYYLNLWSRLGSVDDSALMLELPSALRTEVSLVMNKDILGKVTIFSNSSPGFINSLVAHLKPQSFAPGEFIVKQGDSGAEMYFISRGQVEVIANGKIVGSIGPGGCFGEIAVLDTSSTRTATIRAANYCDLFCLTHENMEVMFKSFPHERGVISKVAATRRAKDLLRKSLQDKALLARQRLRGFDFEPNLVGFLVELFEPVEVEEEAAWPNNLGYIFHREMTAEALYFIGKGFVDIYKHQETSEENSETEENEPMLVCRLAEGMFCGEISPNQGQNYKVSAFVPPEQLASTIMFRLGAQQIGKIENYLQNSYKSNKKLYRRMKKAVAALIQRHSAEEDYLEALKPIETQELAENNGENGGEGGEKGRTKANTPRNLHLIRPPGSRHGKSGSISSFKSNSPSSQLHINEEKVNDGIATVSGPSNSVNGLLPLTATTTQEFIAPQNNTSRSNSFNLGATNSAARKMSQAGLSQPNPFNFLNSFSTNSTLSRSPGTLNEPNSASLVPSEGHRGSFMAPPAAARSTTSFAAMSSSSATLAAAQSKAKLDALDRSLQGLSVDELFQLHFRISSQIQNRMIVQQKQLLLQTSA
jgi:CRP-like cAMP-binding protein